jgi:hypothetical protein
VVAEPEGKLEIGCIFSKMPVAWQVPVSVAEVWGQGVQRPPVQDPHWTLVQTRMQGDVMGL